ncbi:serine hydrolase domain-containing protein [Candidatus Binatus sp.]|uniref:serine hydrolase domain-containing protein n=1 Tax=Candidatus Binatus sp. TaxID=2811406 RepID=UPI003BB075EF
MLRYHVDRNIFIVLAIMNLRRHLLLMLLGVIALAPTGSEGEEIPIPPRPIPAACAPTSDTPTGTAASLLSVLTHAKNAYGLNALIFNATRGSKPILTTALGNSTPGVPASTAMHFRVGMAAEQFEATLLLQLVDEKRINLADLVSKWFPAYPYANLATVQMLASSSSGFGDYVTAKADTSRGIPSFSDLILKNPYQEFNTSELVRLSLSPYQQPQFVNPGGNWAYSHTEFVALGSILETVTKKNYATLLREMILNRLDLHNTVYPSTTEIQSPVLHAYTADRDRYEDSTYENPSWTSFSGQINSDVCDLAVWEQAFGTGKLLTPESAAKITATTNVGLGGNMPALYFGLGTIVNNGWLVASGNFFGWHTATAYYPPTQTALVVTETEGPHTTKAEGVSNDILRQMSRVLTPTTPITLP